MRLSEVRYGILFSLIAIFMGFFLGGLFGGIEDTLKGNLRANGEAVLDTIYAGDRAKMQSVADRGWTYYQRAHLHAGAIGAVALVVSLLLSTLGGSTKTRGVIAGALGIGAIGYSKYWYFAGYLAPSLGSTGAAKESLEWLAIPSAGLLLAGMAATLVLTVRSLFLRKT